MIKGSMVRVALMLLNRCGSRGDIGEVCMLIHPFPALRITPPPPPPPTQPPLCPLYSASIDVVPPDWASALSRLQDSLPPPPPSYVRTIISTTLNQDVKKTFLQFDYHPIASASVAQVS